MRFRRQGPSLVVDAPAKLNLFLEVCGKRPDGYHDLETLMVSIGLCDTLRFTPLTSPETLLNVHCVDAADSRDIPLDDSNLIVRAARLLAAETGCRAGARIDLVKRIPAASGMGGGSSDAAATLVGLNRLWGTGLGYDDLDRLAAQLGSDLNFFIRSPRLAVCRGRGELVTSQPLSRTLHFVVCRPPSGLSTASVFRECRIGTRPVRKSDTLIHQLENGSVFAARNELYNALSDPAARLNGDVAATLSALEECGGEAPLLTGSGSACFCLCTNARHARQVGRRLTNLSPGRVWIVNTCI
jgi:4-diphosphocytidyl-2-C-methyl-D-erythritol kinase